MKEGFDELKVEALPQTASLEAVWGRLGGAYDPPLWQRIDNYPAYLEKVSKFGVTLVCRKEDGIVGSISFYANDPARAFTFVTQLMVADEHQGRGVGYALLKAYEDYSRAQHYSALRLQVKSGNLNARRLYKRFGFTELSRSDSSILMQKDIV